MPRLDQWYLLDPPEQAHGQCLRGVVSDHLNIPEGSMIRTSTIEGKDNGQIVTSSGSHYTLGDPHPEYEQRCPQAKTRLFESLPDVGNQSLEG